MNDFTKDELIVLFLELNIAIRHWGDAEEYKDYPKLRAKIQSMIDNYCECPEDSRMLNCGQEWCVKCKRRINARPKDSSNL